MILYLEKIQLKLNIMIKYFNKIKEKVTGIEARVIQHEFDHLNGVLFTDHLSPNEKIF